MCVDLRKQKLHMGEVIQLVITYIIVSQEITIVTL